MTSQLILGNGAGVALASDSAVTISPSRTYESVEKICELPDPHRLAVMYSGKGLRDRLPVEVLVKEWIRSLPAEPDQSVGNYRDDFVSWFGNKAGRWMSVHNRDAMAWNSLRVQTRRLANLVNEDLDRAEEGEPPTDVVLEALRGVNEDLDHDARIVSSATAESMLEHWWKPDNTLKSPRPGLEEEVHAILGDIPRSETIDEEIRRFLRLVVETGEEFPDGSWTTFNFVGYGANDLYPSVARLELGGSLQKIVFHCSPEPFEVDRAGSSYALIVSAAQDDIIRLILHGWNPVLSRKATSVAIDSLYTSGDLDPPDQEPEGQVGPQEDRLGSSKAAMIEAVETAFRDLTAGRWINRTSKTLAVMPLLDLAAAAEALVTVQALTLDIRGHLPSVGGHIDVATITVNEGFRWISHG